MQHYCLPLKLPWKGLVNLINFLFVINTLLWDNEHNYNISDVYFIFISMYDTWLIAANFIHITVDKLKKYSYTNNYEDLPLSCNNKVLGET